MNDEQKIERIRLRLIMPSTVELPSLGSILARELCEEIDNLVYDAERDTLEWVLREIFEVTP